MPMVFLLNLQNLRGPIMVIIEENGLMQDLIDLMELIMSGIKLKMEKLLPGHKQKATFLLTN